MRTIALDFDAVIHEYHGWNNGILGEPLPGARNAILFLQESGFEVKIFSTRAPSTIEMWLEQYNFPKIEVCKEKPLCIVLVDDRAIRFDGIWDQHMMDSIRNFKAYWEI